MSDSPWVTMHCYKCNRELVAPSWQIGDPAKTRVICSFCDSQIPKFIRIARCHGYPMFWSKEDDHLRCVVKHCDSFVPRPEQVPLYPIRHLLPERPWTPGGMVFTS